MYSYFENFINCWKYCNGFVVINVRFDIRFEECCYFVLFLNDWKYIRVNIGVIFLVEFLSFVLILFKLIVLFVFKVLR